MVEMEKYKLGDICEIVSGSTPKTNIDEYWEGTIKWITPAELNDDTYIITDSVRKITELAVKTQSLRNVLDIDVDLKIVTDNYTVELRKNIFEGDIIYESKDFKYYLNNFYIENSDVIDILNWRDMYGS